MTSAATLPRRPGTPRARWAHARATPPGSLHYTPAGPCALALRSGSALLMSHADAQALTHKLWAKEYLQSTNQADLTNIAQHAMCGVTSELLKPASDPRKVIRLVEQLRSVALARAREGHKQEALVALKQVTTASACAFMPSAVGAAMVPACRTLAWALSTLR